MGITVSITPYQQTIGQYLDDVCGFDNTDATLHLFSNVLDVPAVSAIMTSLVTYIRSLANQQLVLAVGAKFWDCQKAMTRFGNLLQSPTTIVKQVLSNFALPSQRFSVFQHRWENIPAQGYILGVCLNNLK